MLQRPEGRPSTKSRRDVGRAHGPGALLRTLKKKLGLTLAQRRRSAAGSIRIAAPEQA